jgi:excisionase family DNA binding protein
VIRKVPKITEEISMPSSLYASGHTAAGVLLPDSEDQASRAALFSMPLFVSRTRAAQMLAVSVQSIDKLVKQGKLPAIYVGRAVRIKLASLEAYTEEVSIK